MTISNGFYAMKILCAQGKKSVKKKKIILHENADFNPPNF